MERELSSLWVGCNQLLAQCDRFAVLPRVLAGQRPRVQAPPLNRLSGWWLSCGSGTSWGPARLQLAVQWAPPLSMATGRGPVSCPNGKYPTRLVFKLATNSHDRRKHLEPAIDQPGARCCQGPDLLLGKAMHPRPECRH